MMKKKIVEKKWGRPVKSKRIKDYFIFNEKFAVKIAAALEYSNKLTPAERRMNGIILKNTLNKTNEMNKIPIISIEEQKRLNYKKLEDEQELLYNNYRRAKFIKKTEKKIKKMELRVRVEEIIKRLYIRRVFINQYKKTKIIIFKNYYKILVIILNKIPTYNKLILNYIKCI